MTNLLLISAYKCGHLVWGLLAFYLFTCIRLDRFFRKLFEVHHSIPDMNISLIHKNKKILATFFFFSKRAATAVFVPCIIISCHADLFPNFIYYDMRIVFECAKLLLAKGKLQYIVHN